ncbi:hypothetical protein, partial [Sulfitobacter sp. UBA4523]|uniref:hypothetical protein n=1 Tax=Sulfitobacter sp. UBA4523 TaxID=1947584 RepID=UPI00257E07E2
MGQVRSGQISLGRILRIVLTGFPPLFQRSCGGRLRALPKRPEQTSLHVTPPTFMLQNIQTEKC